MPGVKVQMVQRGFVSRQVLSSAMLYIFLCKENNRGLIKNQQKSTAEKTGMTTNPSIHTEIFCLLITIAI